MRIYVNGEELEAPEGATVAALLAKLGVDERTVLVEIDANVVLRSEHAYRVIEPESSLTLLRVASGG